MKEAIRAGLELDYCVSDNPLFDIPRQYMFSAAVREKVAMAHFLVVDRAAGSVQG